MKHELFALESASVILNDACIFSDFSMHIHEGEILGVISELDLMRKQIKPNEPSIWTMIWGMDPEREKQHRDAIRKYMGKTAGDVMTAPAMTVEASDSLEKVGNLMFNKKIKRVFVTEGGKLVGVVSRSAFTKLLLNDEK